MVYPPPPPRPEEIWPFQHPHHFNVANYEDFVFDHISEKSDSKIPPKTDSGKGKAAKLSEPVTTRTRAPDSDAVRHITYRDVQLLFNCES